MTVEFHPAVQQDFNEAIAHYEAEGGTPLTDRFEAEFRFCIEGIKAAPSRFPRYHVSPLFRRIRLHTFPCLIIYRKTARGIRITLLWHERRHPSTARAVGNFKEGLTQRR